MMDITQTQRTQQDVHIRQILAPEHYVDHGVVPVLLATCSRMQKCVWNVTDPQRRNSFPRRRREFTQTGRAAHLERGEITSFSSCQVCRRVCHTGCAQVRL